MFLFITNKAYDWDRSHLITTLKKKSQYNEFIHCRKIHASGANYRIIALIIFKIWRNLCQWCIINTFESDG